MKVFILALAFLCSLSSCQTLQEDAPPYVISKPVCSIEPNPGYYLFAGIEFDFLNISDKNISEINISFMVFDADTESNPFIGSNIIKVNFTDNINPGELKRLIISLDYYMYVAAEKPYLIDFFYVAEIKYADGSSWEDQFGIYYTSSY
jgi:hypothetical protein